MFLSVLVLGLCISINAESTTTTQYDLEVPGSDPIRIVEGEPLWPSTKNVKERSRNERAFHADSEEERDALQEFLKNLRKHNYKPSSDFDNVEVITKPSNRLSGGYFAEEGEEKPKSSWDLLHYEKHNHPYDDKKGWVSMEPVPWSVSKVSKWQSSHKPATQRPNWDLDYSNEDVSRPGSWPSKPYRPSYEPSRPTTNLDIYLNKPSLSSYDNKPTIDSRPVFTRPSAVYAQKVHVSYNPNEDCNHHPHKHPHSDIITDGLPANFPQAYDTNRRRGTDMQPSDTHPFTGEGEWVLLSTTKGYKYPQDRQRSMKFSTDSIGVHRGVRLTVLPPLKNSKVNMTTSHGGLLQVESTFQTVEQAKNQYMKQKQKLKQKPKRKQGVGKPRRQAMVAPTITTATNTDPDGSAVLAAVGAGMIPATMAMLVPIAMNGKKRRKREVSTVLPVTNLEMTLRRHI